MNNWGIREMLTQVPFSPTRCRGCLIWDSSSRPNLPVTLDSWSKTSLFSSSSASNWCCNWETFCCSCSPPSSWLQCGGLLLSSMLSPRGSKEGGGICQMDTQRCLTKCLYYTVSASPGPSSSFSALHVFSAPALSVTVSYQLPWNFGSYWVL